MTDPISDLLTRIRNALAVGKAEVVLPHSKLKAAIADILVARGYLLSATVAPAASHPGSDLKLGLRYRKPGQPAIMNVRRVSKPGARRYAHANALPRVLNGLGIAIVSTSQGLLTDGEARKRKLGGEVICEVY